MRTLRERAGYSLAELADRCRASGRKVHLSHLGAIERGLYKPSAALLKAIAAALEVKVDDLLKHPEQPTKDATS